MSKLFKKLKRHLLVAATLSAALFVTSSFKNDSSFLVDDGDPIYGVSNLVNITYAELDVETENYIPANKMYNRSDALALRDNLQKLYEANPSDLAINFALVKFHANAPNFSGGYKGMALQYAANIYRLNSYVGCLVYEYIYTKNYDLKNAERWYKNSLISRLNTGYEWREVKFVNNAPFGVSVVGPFSNGRLQPLYQNVWGNYTRKIMVPKRDVEFFFTLVPDFLKGSKQQKGELVFTNW
jgi:hypothetical protein